MNFFKERFFMFNFGFLLTSSGSGTTGGTEQTGGGLGAWMPIIMIGLLFVIMYFFMIRPQKKREKQDGEMRDALQVGDEVTTIGGIIGKVVSIKGETFVLETTKDKTKIRFLKAAIRSVDVKSADVAAQIIEAKEAEAKEAEAKEAEAKEAEAEAADDFATPTEAEEKKD